jgi:hypothetical protein
MLPPVPDSVVDTSGEVRVGTYEGEMRAIDWRPVASAWKRMFGAKRWQYVSLFTPEIALAALIIDVGWLASAQVAVFDRSARRLRLDLSIDGLPERHAMVAPHPGEGALSTWHGRGLELRLGRPASTARWTLSGRGERFELAAELDASAAPPTICAIAVPPGARGNSTHKTVGLPVTGSVTVDGQRWSLDGGSAALDYTNGVLARDTTWRWASGTQPGLGINLVEGFNGAAENVVWINDQPIRVGEAHIAIDPRDIDKPFNVRSVDGVVDLEFRIEGVRAQDRDLLVAKSIYVAPFGTYHGVIRPPDAAEIVVDGLPGVCEEHLARW